MMYRFTHDDPETGMSSFKLVGKDTPPPPDLFQVRCTLANGSSSLVEGALDEVSANTYADLMNHAERGQAVYTVEPLTQVDYTPWHEFNRNFKYPGPAAVRIRYDEDGLPVLVSVEMPND